jgi:hypothetical protein
MKRTLDMVESELKEAKQRVDALETERKNHQEHIEHESWFIRGALTKGLFKRFVTDAQGPRLVKYKTTYTAAACKVKDSLYRDEWEVKMRFADGSRFSKTAEFWEYECSPAWTSLDISPTDNDEVTFDSEEALWGAFYVKNGKKDKETLAAIALAAWRQGQREGKDRESIRDAWETCWSAEKQESNEDMSDSESA